MELTAKQKKFCNEYLIDLNGTQAAIRAGYSVKTSNRIASENLRKLDIQDYLKERIQKQEKNTIATAQEVLEYLTRVVRGEEHEEILTRQGDEVIESKSCKVSDKTKAAELLAKRYALLTEKLDIGNKDDKPFKVDYSNLSDDELVKLKEIAKKVAEKNE